MDKNSLTLRVVTANICHARRDATDDIDTVAWRHNLSELAGALRELHPHVICLQEVDYRQWRSGGIDQLDALRAALGWHPERARFCAFFTGQVNWHGLKFRLPVWRGGAQLMLEANTRRSQISRLIGSEHPAIGGYGVAILSRYPVTNWRSLRLGAAPFRFTERNGERRLQTGQVRALLGATISVNGRYFEVGCTHLETHIPTACTQLAHSWRLLRSTPNPAILAGDFNMLPEQVRAASRIKSAQHAHAATVPATEPTSAIDHVLVQHGRVLAAQAVQLPVSDHRALLADIVF